MKMRIYNQNYRMIIFRIYHHTVNTRLKLALFKETFLKLISI